MNDIEDTFVDVIDHLDLPEVDLVPAVLERIAAGERTGLDSARLAVATGGAQSRLWPAALAGAAAMLLVGLVVVTTPVGEAVADWFGIGATAFEVDETIEPADGGPNPEPVPLDDAVSVVPAPDVVPIESLGRPDSVVDDPRRGRSYIWDDGSGQSVILSARSTSRSAVTIKSLAAEDDVEFLTIDVPNESGVSRPLPAVWIGAPHTLTYPIEGLDLELTVDAGPVLIWVDGDVELRLEGAADREQAVALATEILDGTELTPSG